MRYKITIEYDGTNYSGWQKQEGKYTIQDSLEKAIRMISKETVEVFGCGRTDAGVHAIALVAHFDMVREIDPFKLMGGVNYYLKVEYISKFGTNLLDSDKAIQDISVIDCEIVDESFHARFSGKKRYYKYRILNRRSPTALNCNRVWQVHKELDFDAMQKTLPFLVGKRDWTSFRDTDCQAKSPIKTIDKVNLTREGEEIIFEIEAKSFLHHMVRNIVGTLVNVGMGKASIEQFKQIIDACDRRTAGPTAPACGLYFVKIDY